MKPEHCSCVRDTDSEAAPPSLAGNTRDNGPTGPTRLAGRKSPVQPPPSGKPATPSSLPGGQGTAICGPLCRPAMDKEDLS